MNRFEFERGWCPQYALYQGHKVPCVMEDGHRGDCSSSLREVRDHLNGGKAACIRNNCGDQLPADVEHHNVFEDLGECNG